MSDTPRPIIRPGDKFAALGTYAEVKRVQAAVKNKKYQEMALMDDPTALGQPKPRIVTPIDLNKSSDLDRFNQLAESKREYFKDPNVQGRTPNADSSVDQNLVISKMATLKGGEAPNELVYDPNHTPEEKSGFAKKLLHPYISTLMGHVHDWQNEKAQGIAGTPESKFAGDKLGGYRAHLEEMSQPTPDREETTENGDVITHPGGDYKTTINNHLKDLRVKLMAGDMNTVRRIIGHSDFDRVVHKGTMSTVVNPMANNEGLKPEEYMEYQEKPIQRRGFNPAVASGRISFQPNQRR